MSKWQVLWMKELKHLFRDTKTIVQTIVVPTFITPLILGGFFWFVGSIATEETKKTYDISVNSLSESNLIAQISESDRLNIVLEEDVSAVINSVTEGSSEIGLVITETFDSAIKSNDSAEITMYSKNIDTFSQAQSLVTTIIDDFEETERDERLAALNLDEAYVNPISINKEDLTTEEESAGSIFGAILALFFVMYVMTGSMYPAIDLGAGEKERGTMETLISTNISSVDIIIGKMLSVTTSAVLTATFQCWVSQYRLL